jgi:hypothetical protein
VPCNHPEKESDEKGGKNVRCFIFGLALQAVTGEPNPPLRGRVGLERFIVSELTFTTTTGRNHPDNQPELEDGDVLLGGVAIRDFRNKLLGTNTSLSATFKQLVLKQIPAQKTPSGWIASKRGLRRHYARGLGLAA